MTEQPAEPPVTSKRWQPYIPTKREIAAACEAIRDEWDKQTEMSRRAVRCEEVTTPICTEHFP